MLGQPFVINLSNVDVELPDVDCDCMIDAMLNVEFDSTVVGRVSLCMSFSIDCSVAG
jgi:hypothetical protein